MARTKDPAVAARNQRLVQDVTDNRFQTHAELGRKHGMSPQMVYRVLNEADLSSRERNPRRMLGEIRPISNFHLLLGQTINSYFWNQNLDNRGDGKISDLARTLGMSPQRVSAIIKGVEDVTLSELKKVEEWTKTPIHELLEACSKKERTLRLPPSAGNSGS